MPRGPRVARHVEHGSEANHAVIGQAASFLARASHMAS